MGLSPTLGNFFVAFFFFFFCCLLWIPVPCELVFYSQLSTPD